MTRWMSQELRERALHWRLLHRSRRRVVVPALFLILLVALLSSVRVAAGSPDSGGDTPGLPSCGRQATTGSTVSPWRMGALQFFSPTTGVGVTASAVICFRHSKEGSEVSFRSQPVRLALTADGGRFWRLTGAAAPTGPTMPGPAGGQLVAASTRRIWAIVGRDRLVATTDGGRSWKQATIGGPAVALMRSGGFVWAVTCPSVASRDSPLACRPHLWRAPQSTGVWTEVKLPELTAQALESVDVTISSGHTILLTVMTAGKTATGEMAVSTDGGTTWRTHLDPRWDGHACTFGSELATAPPQTFWLLCDGNGAAGSSPKGLLRTTDAGATWHTVSAVTSLIHTPPAGSIPLAEPSALAAGSSNRLWLSVTNGLAETDDGGKTWTNVPTVFNVGGWSTTLSVLNATHAWLLAPGAGLWSTTDGEHWEPIGPLHTH